MIKGNGMQVNIGNGGELISRKVIIAVILGIALVAFEIFNFDTTQYALTDLLGEIRFAGILWASILAIAFCAIDFAGLVRIFTPQRGSEEPKAVWFLVGAWFLGTIANAIMTWWAVSLTLLGHEFGNEVLSREALLRYVPIFVAMLIWLTRILFIGAFSVAGENMFESSRGRSDAASPSPRRDVPAAVPARAANPQPAAMPVAAKTTAAPRSSQPTAQPKPAPAPSRPPVTYEPVDDPVMNAPAVPKTNGSGGSPAPTSRIQQRPPMPGTMGRTPAAGNVSARSSKGSH